MTGKGWKSECAALVLLFVMALSSCATVQTTPPAAVAPKVTPASQAEQGWWYARFRMNWPQGQKPRWYVDMLLAREVVQPVMKSFHKDITLWRFHRRALRDDAGHQFSFIFYSTPETADRIFNRLRQSRELEDLLAHKVVVKVSYDKTDKIRKPGIGDTSDPTWTKPLQNAWPYFIMGVSRTWLDLIDQFAAQAEAKGAAGKGKDKEALYREVNERMVELWRNEGGHAFLHHLNALFGYEGILIYERRVMSF